MLTKKKRPYKKKGIYVYHIPRILFSSAKVRIDKNWQLLKLREKFIRGLVKEKKGNERRKK